ncbi:hypothetical protein SDC9_142014 [bioreactor metagenome]|uniref:Uncharacterized protein n=1 Tax=bioreactor metagenome TaxID=1076179 RepID=A0A645DZY8_9ZZZZ
MHAKFSSISGAIVISLITSAYCFTKAASGFSIYSSACAPFFSGFINGPSTFAPSICAPVNTSYPSVLFNFSALITDRAFSICVFATVIVVGQNAVTPFASKPCAIFVTPSSLPSLTSIPSYPWIWISISPGATYLPAASISCSIPSSV